MPAGMSDSELLYQQSHIADDVRPNLIAACAISLGMSYVAVALRFFARWKARARYGWDDWSILMGLSTATGFVIASFFMISFGLGQHAILVTNVQALIQSVVASQLLYCISIVPIKISILCLYGRLFPSKDLHKLSIALGSFIVIYSLTQAICMVLQCIPLSALWTGEGHCLNFQLMLTIMSIINVVTDFMLISLPVPFLWNLRVDRTRKFQLIGTFLLGGMVCVFGIVRTIYVSLPVNPADPSWDDVSPALWSILEITFGVFSACLPTLRPLFFPRAAWSGTGSNSYGYRSGNRSGNRSGSRHPGSSAKPRRTANLDSIALASRRQSQRAPIAGGDEGRRPFAKLGSALDQRSVENEWEPRAVAMDARAESRTEIRTGDLGPVAETRSSSESSERDIVITTEIQVQRT